MASPITCSGARSPRVASGGDPPTPCTRSSVTPLEPASAASCTLGNATVAPAGMKVYASRAIPGWHDSLLLTSMISGVVFRMSLTEDRRNPVSAPVAYFKTGNRYRDIVAAPDGVRFFIVTDADGRTVGASGALVRDLVNPGAVLEFRYTRAGT